MHTIVLFYKYVTIEDPEALLEKQQELCEYLGLKGRMIIAREGINATLEGLKDKIIAYQEVMRQDPRFSDTHFKVSEGTGESFPRLRIKVRPEIVSAHLGEADVLPSEVPAGRVAPGELQAWLDAGKEIYIVDMRNDYEQKVGHFTGSILSEMENFRDLPEFTKKIEHLKNKIIVPVCTGGIRCEKAASYLVTQGFKDVYQLDGGIVSYMEQYPNKHFKGKLYVFDNRIVMDFDTPETGHTVVGKCDKCGIPSELYVNCSNLDCHRHFICCENCRETNGEVFCGDQCRLVEVKQL